MKSIFNATDWVGLKKHLLTFIGGTYLKGYRRFVEVRCDCGVTKYIEWQNFKGGKIKSCGCQMYPQDGHSKDILYPIWHDIRARCNNPNHVQYHRYGGNGVRICDEWDKSYYAFRDWCLANGWKKGLQVDKDAKGGLLYSPETCSILTPAKNTQLRGVVKLTVKDVLEIRGTTGSADKVAKRYGVSREHIRSIRIGKNWKEI